jgi:hypothetical protein
MSVERVEAADKKLRELRQFQRTAKIIIRLSLRVANGKGRGVSKKGRDHLSVVSINFILLRGEFLI